MPIKTVLDTKIEHVTMFGFSPDSRMLTYVVRSPDGTGNGIFHRLTRGRATLGKPQKGLIGQVSKGQNDQPADRVERKYIGREKENRVDESDDKQEYQAAHGDRSIVSAAPQSAALKSESHAEEETQNHIELPFDENGHEESDGEIGSRHDAI